MTGKERVKRAIEFGHPDRVPVYASEDTDVVRLSYVDPTGWLPRQRPPGEFKDEWHSVWYTGDETMGRVRRPAIPDLGRADDYVLPDPRLPARWAGFDAQMEEHSDHYVVGNAQYLCFDRLTFLLGEEQALVALLTQRHDLEALADRVIEFETAIVDELADRGVDGIRFWDDIGGQSGVVMGLTTWREVFRSRYARIFEHIRARGLHVHWHSCGNCMDVMDDLVEMGVHVMSIGEPFMMGVAALAERFAGRVCFESSPDNRTILSTGSRERIEWAVQELVSRLATPEGGLILVAAPDNFDCVSEEARRTAVQAVLQAAKGG